MKVLKSGWHDYGLLSIYVDLDGYCYGGILYDRYGNGVNVFPYRLGSSSYYIPVAFKAYSGFHRKYQWRE